jgi:hypothetical protein
MLHTTTRSVFLGIISLNDMSTKQQFYLSRNKMSRTVVKIL